jgi:uncharacterized integral membrane protein
MEANMDDKNMRGKELKNYIKSFTFEIIAAAITLMLIIFLLIDKDFSKRLITNFMFFRPEYSFTLFIVFAAISAVLVLLFITSARRKKLKSTKKLSPFAKTVERSHKVREMSQTQVEYSTTISAAEIVDIMPKDVAANPNIIEFYFEREEKLNI